jgi:hypothetical protein
MLAGLLSKVAGLGTVAKAALAALTAALTMTVAGGATGVLPLPGGHSDPAAVVQAAVQPTGAGTSATVSVAATPAAGTSVGVGTGASVPPAGASTAAHATFATPPVVAPTTGNVVSPVAAAANAALPTLPALPACIKDLIPAKGTAPDPAKFLAQLTACIKSIVAAHLPVAGGVAGVPGAGNLPANLPDIAKCLSSVFSSMPGLAGGASGGSLSPAQLQALPACVPAGTIPGLGSGSIPGLGSILGTGSTPTHTPGK